MRAAMTGSPSPSTGWRRHPVMRFACFRHHPHTPFTAVYTHTRRLACGSWGSWWLFGWSVATDTVFTVGAVASHVGNFHRSSRVLVTPAPPFSTVSVFYRRTILSDCGRVLVAIPCLIVVPPPTKRTGRISRSYQTHVFPERPIFR